jgi:L-alanine-DL-glutamate epimerase-like enolase superfamily enzyme
MFSISDYQFASERQPLIRPFHFKGGFFTEKWINVVKLFVGDARRSVTAIGGNAVLWSDANVFAEWSEDGGNSLMTLLAERAAQLACGSSYENPIDAFGSIRGEVHEYARRITGRPDVTPTFTLNAMAALDFAMWKAHALETGSERLHDLLPATIRGAFAETSEALVRAPLISYNVPINEVVALVHEGHRVLKVKLGQDGSPSEMVEKDARRLEELHRALEGQADPVHYYLDANGRYPDIETLKRLLHKIDDLGILSHVLILEEPFPYATKIDVNDLPVRVAADESLHDVDDLKERIDLGYRALALKPAGKTLSLSVLMAAKAAEYDIPCFVADSACVPLLVEWNRAFAAHLPPFPGLGMGLIESNGSQNYANWDALQAEHPLPTATWLEPRHGVFRLTEEFFSCSGGVFREVGHYEELVKTISG